MLKLNHSDRPKHLRYAALLVVAILLSSVVCVVLDTKLVTSDFLKAFRTDLNPAPSRLLRTKTKIPSNSEERVGGSVSTIERLKTLITPLTVSEKTLQNWLKSGKSADAVFKRLKLSNAKDKLFDYSQFEAWVKYVDKYYSTRFGSTIETLIKYYGNEALSQMIIAAQKVPNSQVLATDLQNRQLKYWLRGYKSPVDVYKLLMLDKAGDKLLESAQFTTWLSYLDSFNRKDYYNAKSDISTLMKLEGDEGLSRILLEAMKIGSTAGKATSLHSALIQRWLVTQTSPNNIFTFLMLGKAGDKLFDNPQFSTWVNYVNDFNNRYPDNKTPLVSVLAKHYNSEELAKMIEAAKKVPGSEKIMKRLESEQKWLNKDTPDALFKRLKLHKEGDDLLSSPHLKVWIDYMKDYNKDNLKYQTTLIATLVKHCGEKNVVKMIDAGKKVKSTAIVAKRLQAEQFQLWLNKRWKPSYTFTLMNLDDTGNKLLSSPGFATWMKYLNMFNAENPGKKTTLIASILAGGYSNSQVVQLLDTAKKIPSTEVLSTKLTGDLIQHWLTAEKFPPNLFSTLELDKAGDKLLIRPQFRIWIQYSDDFNRNFPEAKISVVATLRSHYEVKILAKIIESARTNPSTENVAKRVERELFQSWFTDFKTPDRVFVILQLYTGETNFFENPVFNTWARYLTEYNKANSPKASMIGTLRKYYGEQKLLKMINTATMNPNTEKLALDLLHAFNTREIR